MKNLTKSILIKLLFVGFLLSGYSTLAQKTTIYLVRHAEKETTQGNDPDLTKDGRQRAIALLKKLEGEKITAVYVSNYKRTKQTGEPTAQNFKLTEQVYSVTDLNAFASKLLQDNKGKNVLVIGHSNTVIPTIAALGAAKPFDTLTDDDYDMLFKVTIGKNGKTVLKVSYYGEKHHTTQIPGN